MPRPPKKKPPPRHISAPLTPNTSINPIHHLGTIRNDSASSGRDVGAFLSSYTASTNAVELGEPKGTKTTLEVEIILTNIAGTNAVETCLISAGQVVAAQRIIAGAKLANEEAQNKVIDKAIQLLYPYPPHQS